MSLLGGMSAAFAFLWQWGMLGEANMEDSGCLGDSGSLDQEQCLCTISGGLSLGAGGREAALA